MGFVIVDFLIEFKIIQGHLPQQIIGFPVILNGPDVIPFWLLPVLPGICSDR